MAGWSLTFLVVFWFLFFTALLSYLSISCFFSAPDLLYAIVAVGVVPSMDWEITNIEKFDFTCRWVSITCHSGMRASLSVASITICTLHKFLLFWQISHMTATLLLAENWFLAFLTNLTSGVMAYLGKRIRNGKWRQKRALMWFPIFLIMASIFANEDGTENLHLDKFWMSLTVAELTFETALE